MVKNRWFANHRFVGWDIDVTERDKKYWSLDDKYSEIFASGPMIIYHATEEMQRYPWIMISVRLMFGLDWN